MVLILLTGSNVVIFAIPDEDNVCQLHAAVMAYPGLMESLGIEDRDFEVPLPCQGREHSGITIKHGIQHLSAMQRHHVSPCAIDTPNSVQSLHIKHNRDILAELRC